MIKNAILVNKIDIPAGIQTTYLSDTKVEVSLPGPSISVPGFLCSA